jgi:hypothetical protein
MGYLTGKIDARTTFDSKTDLRSEFERFSPENLAANMPVVDLLRRFAEKKNATPAHLNENLGQVFGSQLDISCGQVVIQVFDFRAV